MISGLDLSQTVDYSLKNDTENPTIWKIGVIPSYLFAMISDGANEKQIETVYKFLQVGIKGWENFNIPHETVKEKMFGREIDVVPMSIIERIPMRIVTELSMKIMEVNQITEVERKN